MLDNVYIRSFFLIIFDFTLDHILVHMENEFRGLNANCDECVSIESNHSHPILFDIVVSKIPYFRAVIINKYVSQNDSWEEC